jgi:putative DNA methylase
VIGMLDVEAGLRCPQCDAEGYNYNGRDFKLIGPGDVKRLILAEREWAESSDKELSDY